MSPSAQSPNAPNTRSRMPELFLTIRVVLYATVILFTVICLGMAGHFQSVLAASDLTRFVPFAIFVCSATLFIFIILLAFSFFFRERNPITTKIELSSLGVTGIFWLILGVFLATSDSKNADVECFSAENQLAMLDPEIAPFQTDQYQAMYRVLNTFSLLNAILILFAFFALLLLALRRHRMGEKHMWNGPVTSCAWFDTYAGGKPRQSKGSSILPIATAQMGVPIFTEKPERKAGARRDRSTRVPDAQPSTYPYPSQSSGNPQPSRNAQPSRNPEPVPPKTIPTRQGSGGSPRADPYRPDLENGGMMNPYRMRAGPR